MKNLASILIIYFSYISLSLSGQPYNYGAEWQLLSLNSREAYINGVSDGIILAYPATALQLDPNFYQNQDSERYRNLVNEIMIHKIKGQLREMVTDLYREPANSYISTLIMVVLARDKIQGKRINEKIIEYRKSALETHKLNEKK